MGFLISWTEEVGDFVVIFRTIFLYCLILTAAVFAGFGLLVACFQSYHRSSGFHKRNVARTSSNKEHHAAPSPREQANKELQEPLPAKAELDAVEYRILVILIVFLPLFAGIYGALVGTFLSVIPATCIAGIIVNIPVTVSGAAIFFVSVGVSGVVVLSQLGIFTMAYTR